MYGFENILLNILFLIVFLLYIPLLLQRNVKGGTKETRYWIRLGAYVLAIMTCMIFPIKIVDGLFFDLRWIPVIVGTLYGGFPAAVVLFGTVVGYRFLLGGIGVYPNIVIAIIIVLMGLLLTKRFVLTNKKNKIIMGSSLAVFAGMLQLFILFFIFKLHIEFIYIILYPFILFAVTTLIIYTIGVMREARYLNRKVITAEKIEVVSHLASSISHEVRNPLTVVRGFLQMMNGSHLDEEKRKEYISISIKEIDRAIEIIQNYLTFAKPSPEMFHTINVEEELKRAIEIVTPLANMNCVEIKSQLRSCCIKGDVQLIQQCLLNISKNCIEAMPTGGTLLLETIEEWDHVIIKITDNGLGMSEEELLRIGEPYFTTKGEAGTGLGMMTTIRIIEQLGGTLNITSKKNSGTQFVIRIPKADSRNET